MNECRIITNYDSKRSKLEIRQRIYGIYENFCFLPTEKALDHHEPILGSFVCE